MPVHRIAFTSRYDLLLENIEIDRESLGKFAHDLAFFRRNDATRRAHEQAFAENGLQNLHRLRERGLRDPEAYGRLPKRAELHDDGERSKFLQVVPNVRHRSAAIRITYQSSIGFELV